MASVYEADLIFKVKEPQPAELPLLRNGQILFCYLHLAADPRLAQALLERGVTAIGFETVEDGRGRTPLLAPMSQIADRMAIQAGMQALKMRNGGRGVLLSGVPGVPPAWVAVIGGGQVGANAARVAIGLGADVTLARAQPGQAAALRRPLWRAAEDALVEPDQCRECLAKPIWWSAPSMCTAAARPS